MEVFFVENADAGEKFDNQYVTCGCAAVLQRGLQLLLFNALKTSI